MVSNPTVYTRHIFYIKNGAALTYQPVLKFSFNTRSSTKGSRTIISGQKLFPSNSSRPAHEVPNKISTNVAVDLNLLTYICPFLLTPYGHFYKCNDCIFVRERIEWSKQRVCNHQGGSHWLIAPLDVCTPKSHGMGDVSRNQLGQRLGIQGHSYAQNISGLGSWLKRRMCPPK